MSGLLGSGAYTLAGVLAGGGVGYFAQRALARERATTERSLAQDARMFEKRSAVYVEILIVRNRHVVVTEQRYPIVQVGGPPAPPTALSVDGAIELVANVDAFATSAVREADHALHQAINAFMFMADLHTTQHFQKTGNSGIDFAAYPVLEEQRAKIRALYADLAECVRRELHHGGTGQTGTK